jgi:Flp pilus assembly protein TadD
MSARRMILLSFICLAAVALSGCDKAHSDSVRLTNKGMKALSKNDLKAAQGFFEHAVSVSPENARAHYGLGIILAERGPLKEARHHLREATTLSPELTEAFFQLGVIALKEKKYDEAEQVLKRCLEQDPDHDAAHLIFGQIFEHKGELKQAEVAYRKAVTLNPYQADAFLRLARLYYRVQADSEAVAILREGIRINNPDTVQVPAHLSLLHNELAISLQAEGRYGEAIDELRKAVTLPGAATEVAFNLGWAYASKGNSEMALQYFNQYIQLSDASDPTVKVAVDVARHLSERLRTPE